jgi:hypothetical protein
MVHPQGLERVASFEIKDRLSLCTPMVDAGVMRCEAVSRVKRNDDVGLEYSP